MKVYPVGAAVFVDGKHTARVVQAFPEGSASYAFPHYKVRYSGAPKHEQTAVAWSRVGATYLEPMADYDALGKNRT